MNTRSYITLITIITATCCLSCKKDKEAVAEVPESPKPTAGFTYKVVSTDDPFTFKFENLSTNFKEVRWEFGDDSTTTEGSPVHTYINTGDYRVRVISKNDQGYWAQRETIIKLRPDSIFSIGSKVNADGSITLGLTSPVKTRQISWFKITQGLATLVKTAETVTVTVPAGTFDTYVALISTPKGSQAQLTRQVGSAGVLKDVTQDGIFAVSRDNDSGPSAQEGSLKLIDNNTRSKFVQFNYKEALWARLDFGQSPVVAGGYSITSGDDAIERDPKNFTLEGSDDMFAWQVLDQHTGESFPTRGLTKTYLFTNNRPFHYYRLNVSANNGAGLIQIAEWRLLVMQ